MATFDNDKILDGSEWTQLVSTVEKLHKTRSKQWIYRALDPPKTNNDKRVVIDIPSSLDRVWESRSDLPPTQRWRYEAWMIREFKRAAYLYRSDLPAPNDLLEWLALGRHYGMPARLVDFSYTYYMPFYFALSGKKNGEDGFVLAVNLKSLKKKTEDALLGWNLAENDRDRDFHNPEAFRRYAFMERPTWVAPVAPSRRNERLLNQKGLFLCPGNIELSFEKNLTVTSPTTEMRLIRLRSTLRKEGIEALSRMNMDMRLLYPDLTGLAQSTRDLVHRDIDADDRRFELELHRAIAADPWC